MCEDNPDEMEPGDYEDETTNEGFQRRSFRDGTSEVDFGPMGGKVRYNEFGEDC